MDVEDKELHTLLATVDPFGNDLSLFLDDDSAVDGDEDDYRDSKYFDETETLEDLVRLWFNTSLWPSEFRETLGDLYAEWPKAEVLGLLFALEQGLSILETINLRRSDAERMPLTENARKILLMQPAHPYFPLLFWEEFGPGCVMGLEYLEQHVAALEEYPRMVEAFHKVRLACLMP